MQALFSHEYRYLWMAGLAIALWFPVRNLIWVMTVRRAIRKAGEDAVDTAESDRLKRRAGATAAILCSLFALGYVSTLFGK